MQIKFIATYINLISTAMMHKPRNQHKIQKYQKID
jgi:hypothetical protein